MAKNWAIAIGVNQYDYLQPLNYAKRDAPTQQKSPLAWVETMQTILLSVVWAIIGRIEKPSLGLINRKTRQVEIYRQGKSLYQFNMKLHRKELLK
ncbi:hypothetical protein [Anabaena subtropica]|uniref:Transposase n=1 Tax=Anabaena subtropica FACHB-260 TaxID=2692884 RepID=A0ABR8CUE0_9NOST|nr:hypothetical protein [Anabaena subtropica]MBD2346801.1 hypothetical protein [Anabaena subtropica FACHB-260]